MRDLLFDQVTAVAEGRPFPAALIVLDANNGAALRRTRVRHSINQIHRRSGRRFSQGLTNCLRRCRDIRAVHCSLEPWTIEEGLITPTFKVRRKALQRWFATQMNELYSDHR